MEDFPVTLIVKVPNQQIEDQTVKCELTWTINKLKEHLSEVHPSKPPQNEQRLIYSGQLLPDSACLKDVLRQYEGQDVHTVHLVCVSKNDFSKCQSPKNMTSRLSQNVNSNTSLNSARNNDEPRVPNLQFPDISQYPNFSEIDPNQYALHMAWMQQAYVQYMMQYMNLAANANYNHETILTSNPNQRNAEENLQEANRPGAAVVRDPEVPERDWLDIFYTVIRVMVLFSIVYCYSNPLRFIVVFMLGIGFYLYQTGFIRSLNNNNNINTTTDNQNVEEQTPSALTILWTFFTTFFASLFPEIPNAL